MNLVSAVSIAHVRLVATIRRWGFGFVLPYRLFLVLSVATVPAVGAVAFAVGVLYYQINKQVDVEGFGLWVAAAALLAAWMVSGSRKRRLDAPLNSLLPTVDWRFCSQCGCSVLTYVVGRFFLGEIGKYAMIVSAAAGLYIGLAIYAAAGVEPAILLMVIFFPLFLAVIQLSQDAMATAVRYRPGSGSHRWRGKVALILMGLRYVFIGVFLVSLPWGQFHQDGVGWVREQIGERSAVAAVVVLYVLGVSLVIGTQSVYRLKSIRWVDVTSSGIIRMKIFVKKGKLPDHWLGAVVVADVRRTVRAVKTRVAPTARVISLFFCAVLIAIFVVLSGGAALLPDEVPLTVLVCFCLGTVTYLLSLGMAMVFSMDSDRNAYTLWRTTDVGFSRVVAARALTEAVFLYGVSIALAWMFLGATRIDIYIPVMICVGCGAVLAVVKMMVLSARWPNVRWSDTSELMSFAPVQVAADFVVPGLMLGIAFMADGVSGVLPWFGMLTALLSSLVVVPLLSVGLSVAGYRVLRKGITAC